VAALGRTSAGSAWQIGDEKVEEVVRTALETKPKGATHWSTRMMAQNLGLSQSTVSRIWRAFGLRPHRSETFQISKDPYFIEKVRDIVGLYMSRRSMLWSCAWTRKARFRRSTARNRFCPCGPAKSKGTRPNINAMERRPLFAALDVATGNGMQCFRRHRTAEFRKFLDYVDSQVQRIWKCI